MKLIKELLQEKTHIGVTDIVKRYVDTNLFNITEGDLWLLITPKNIKCSHIPCLSAHTDTVSAKKPTRFKLEGSLLTNPDGVLGADDRAGIWIMCNLLSSNNTNYSYAIFDLEEVGGLGSEAFVVTDEYEVLDNHTSVYVGLDRRGFNQVATYGYDNMDILDEFAEEWGYIETMGSFTDIVNLSHDSYNSVSCINLSVGYDNEHTKKEVLNLIDMKNTLDILKDKVWLSEVYEYSESRGCSDLNQWTGLDWKNSEYILEPVFCDVCGAHAPLYDVEWGLVCSECVEFAQKEVF